MSDDIESVPVENVDISKQRPPSAEPKVGSEEFAKELTREFRDGDVWRKSTTLAKKLGVDTVELDKYLRTQACVASRPSKAEGVFLYALVERLEKPATDKKDDKVEKVMRPLVTEEDRYALATFHSAFLLLDAALQKYALKVHERNPEAFNCLVAGKDKIEAGIVLFATKVKADVGKLPKV